MNPQDPLHSNTQPDAQPQVQEPLRPAQPADSPVYSDPPLVERIMSNWFVSWILVPAGLIFFLHYFVFSAYHVIGSSMVPTLHNADYLIIGKVDKTLNMIQNKPYIPARDEVIVFHYPKQPELEFVKRVVGLPGDRVVIRDGVVRVYNAGKPQGLEPDATHKINGTYTQGDTADNPIDITVPPRNIYVLGDNRAPGGSSDSREWGFVPADDIIGNVVLRLYPFDQVRVFNDQQVPEAKATP